MRCGRASANGLCIKYCGRCAARSAPACRWGGATTARSAPACRWGVAATATGAPATSTCSPSSGTGRGQSAPDRLWKSRSIHHLSIVRLQQAWRADLGLQSTHEVERCRMFCAPVVEQIVHAGSIMDVFWKSKLLRNTPLLSVQVPTAGLIWSLLLSVVARVASGRKVLRAQIDFCCRLLARFRARWSWGLVAALYGAAWQLMAAHLAGVAEGAFIWRFGGFFVC